MSLLPLVLSDIFRADVRTSRDADALNSKLQTDLRLDFRYQVARLSLALSLAEASPPPPAPDLLGRPIRGETLFGQSEAELALWVALIVEHDPQASGSRRQFLERTAAHWERGSQRLARAWSRFEGRPDAFLEALAGPTTQRRVERTAKTA